MSSAALSIRLIVACGQETARNLPQVRASGADSTDGRILLPDGLKASLLDSDVQRVRHVGGSLAYRFGSRFPRALHVPSAEGSY